MVHSRQLEPLSGASVQHVFSIGKKPGVLDELDPIFDEFSIEARRIVGGKLALEQLHLTVPDLLVVEHPLPDMPTDGFVGAIRDLVQRPLTIVVLAPLERVCELSEIEESGEIVLQHDGPKDEFLASAKAFLRRDRRTPCTAMARISVGLGASRLLRIAQMVNLSDNGMLIRTSEHLPLGSEVLFEILLSDEEEPLRGSARTMRYVRSNDGEILGIGLMFLEVDDESQETLHAFLSANSS